MAAGRLLVADLDGTLLGDEPALCRFADWLGRRHDRFRLVYASGRHQESVAAVIAGTALPDPDAVISAVGTEIHDSRWRPWPGWRERFEGWDAAAVRRILRPIRWLELQPDEAQTPLKASYDVQGLTAADLATVRQALSAAGVASTLVHSANLHLDVLPPATGKGIAARFLADAWAVAAEDVLVFGDTGNDMQLFQQGFRGTLVANALPELSLAVGADVYRSPLPYASGVLDGVIHWSGG